MLLIGDRDLPGEIVVRELTDATVTLDSPRPRQDITHPGTLGMFWDGGYAQVREVTGLAGTRVTRRFEMLAGTPPPVCPGRSYDKCPRVGLGSYAYPSDPGDVGLGFDSVEYESPLGLMGAWSVPASGSSAWALHVHGWTANRREAIRLLRPINDAGWNSLVIEYRNDPGAPSDPSGMHRFGLSEWEDLEAAVAHLVALGADSMALVGYSTGAAHAMAFLERSRLDQRIVALVLDSPNIDLERTVRHGSMGSRFPVVNLPVTSAITRLGMWMADRRWGVDWVATNYLSRAETTIKVPTLVFHGSADLRVPVSVGRDLASAAPHLITYHETPDAGHVMSWNADSEGYERRLTRFLRDV